VRLGLRSLAPCLYDHRFNDYDDMKTIILIATLITVLCVQLHSQDAGSNKKQQKTQQGPQRDADLLGDDNDAESEEPNEDDRANYRKNEVSGNPNNRTVGDGSNRESESGVNTNESAEGIPSVGSGGNSADNDSTSSSGAGNDSVSQSQSNTNSNTSGSTVIEHTSSGSGSPAMPAGENGRDGTNSMQRAKGNMAGSNSRGLSKGKANVDQDEEIKKGTAQQQNTNPSDNAGRPQVGSQGDQGVVPSVKTKASDAKTQSQSDNKQVAGPTSRPNNNTGVKQAIDSEAENTNEQKVADETEPTEVKAMDSESKPTADDSKDKKSKKHKKRRHKH
jgi:hypothetical protein